MYMLRLPVVVAVLSLFVLSSVAQLPTLLNALQSSGAYKFAQFIESNPTIAALYFSGKVKTVFAPSDEWSFPSSRRKRQSTGPAQEQQGSYQVSRDQKTLADMSTPPGDPTFTQDTSGNTGGQPQAVVSDTRNTTSPGMKRRSYAPSRRWEDEGNSTAPPSLLKIFSGLGNNVSIIKADIAYDGGLIHITNGYFTLPEPLSITAEANGHTSFLSLLNGTNQTAVIDATPAVTVFIPSNAALSSPNGTSAYKSSSSLLSAQIIPNFIGYLPNLKNGATYVTTGGTNITITVRGNDYFVNNAKIVNANLILENGVAHVVDQVVGPGKITPVVVTTSGSSRTQGGILSALAFSGAILSLALF